MPKSSRYLITELPGTLQRSCREAQETFLRACEAPFPDPVSPPRPAVEAAVEFGDADAPGRRAADAGRATRPVRTLD